jgi:agmatinase
MRPPGDYDIDRPASPDSGLFGLPHSVDEAAVRVIPVPWDGTTVTHKGTSGAPDAVLEASHQMELYHPVWRDAIWPFGVAMEPAAAQITTWNEQAAAERRGEVVNPLSWKIDELVRGRVGSIFAGRQIPAVLGGEHSVALGGMLAATERHPGVGILQIDAHAGLRVARDGLQRSHASVMHNLLASAVDLGLLVQVGLRDFGRDEARRMDSEPRIRAFADHELQDGLARGTSWSELTERILEPLPQDVWVTVDVAGLDPSLAPWTSSPVPGGLSWHQATFLLRALVRSNRRVVGFDICSVGEDPWDANVGARLLYELAGCAIKSGRAV